jgi:predicted dehydrogenase
MTEQDANEFAFASHLYAEAYQGNELNMSPLDPYKWELEGFAHAIRTNAPILCDGVRATQAAAACYAGQESLNKNERVELRPLQV